MSCDVPEFKSLDNVSPLKQQTTDHFISDEKILLAYTTIIEIKSPTHKIRTSANRGRAPHRFSSSQKTTQMCRCRSENKRKKKNPRKNHNTTGRSQEEEEEKKEEEKTGTPNKRIKRSGGRGV
ncbi:hypothetical protein GWI33_019417 [Rhynchophorus ferrugineus]|uniref:Uncharacterized protein n=1 Tax=Rhynchophorus ferrugineus TaxID=354439 RepID=A0A834M720_RHYFE|nr:hypothetical protein GWI33_019417 [Rhynchophorus ferrugineus]